MALNIAVFRKRLLTAIVFVAVMLVGLLWNQWSFFVLFSIIHFGCWIEYQKIVGLIHPPYNEITGFHRYGVMVVGWCLMLFLTHDVFNIGDFSLHSIGWWLGLILVFLLPLVELLFSKSHSAKDIGYSLGGLLYISIPWALMISLYEYNYNAQTLFDTQQVIDGDSVSYTQPIVLASPRLPILIILGIWINDTMAYLVGSFIGKTPFSKISPKKTWEGTIGGMILCVAIIGFVAGSPASAIVGIPQGSPIPGYHWFVIAGIVAVAGTVGDLFESKLKRLANIKDSGQIMPGHGGFLDRFDSLLYAVPFVWLYVWFFM